MKRQGDSYSRRDKELYFFHKDADYSSLPIKAQNTIGVESVSSGGFHNAIVCKKKLFTFGEGNYGQLGHSMFEEINLRKEVIDVKDVIFVSCGFGHTAVITETLGKKSLYTFGRGKEGQLGHGDNNNIGTPKRVEGFGDFCDIIYVSCGLYHTAVITKENGTNRLYTFGCGKYGQLGQGNNSDYNSPKEIISMRGADKVCCGYKNTAVIKNKKLYTFGSGKYGQLGHGDNLNLNVPTLVDGLDNVTHISIGKNHMAVIVNQSDSGKLFTFGKGSLGQLGHGNNDDINVPKEVKTFHNAKFVSCGGDRTAVIDYSYYCTKLFMFGNCFTHLNDPGKITTTPILNLYTKNVKSVSCGHDNTFLIM